jgi:hypothetical protein
MEYFLWHLKWNNLFVIPPDFLLTDWDDLPRKSFWMHFWNFKSKWNFCFCKKKKLQTMVTRAIYTSLFSWHSFFLKRYYTHKKVSLLSVSVSVPWWFQLSFRIRCWLISFFVSLYVFLFCLSVCYTF